MPKFHIRVVPQIVWDKNNGASMWVSARMWETWTEFSAPGSGPDPALVDVDIWGVNQ